MWMKLLQWKVQCFISKCPFLETEDTHAISGWKDTALPCTSLYQSLLQWMWRGRVLETSFVDYEISFCHVNNSTDETRREELFAISNVLQKTVSYRMTAQVCAYALQVRRVVSFSCLCFIFSGYYAEQNAIIVFAACFLPDSNCDNYNYVMENLFL